MANPTGSKSHDRGLLAAFRIDPKLKQGRLFAIDLPDMLSHPDAEGGNSRWQSQDFTEQEARDAVKAYAAWLIKVANEAR